MLDNETKRKIDSARSILVGKVPDPKAQVEQITTALIYKFMDDMDREAELLGGKAKFITAELEEFKWANLMAKSIGGSERLNLYMSALLAFAASANIPEIFRTIFKDAFLPYRDSETLNLFLKEIDYFDYDHSENLGNAFEYLLSILGSQGDAGQFRTPRHIIDFIVEILQPKKDETVLDPACGTAGFLISAYKHIMANNKLVPDEKKLLMQNFTGYDISPDMVRLSLVNMYLHSFPTPKIYEYDTLTSEDRWNDSFDVILANPPFMTPKGGIRPHNRFSVQANRSEVLFVDYIAEHLSLSGRAGIIIPEGIIFQSANAYKALRKMLIENGFLWAVVSLPAGIFQPYSGVKTSILLLDRTIAKNREDILFIKISNDGYDLGAQRREINKNDLPEALEILKNYRMDCHGDKSPRSDENGVITETVIASKTKQSIALIVSKSKIAESGDYNLTGDRYRDNTRAVQSSYPMVKLEEVCEFIRGITFSSKDHVDENYVLVATTKAAQADGIRTAHLVKVRADIIKNEKTYLQNGDMLISVANSSNLLGRKTYVKNIETNKISFGAFMGCLRPNRELILPEFLNPFLESEAYKNFCLSRANTTTNISNLNWGDLSQFEIPLPPLEIQNQIVAQIEEWQKIIDGAKQVINSYRPTIDIDLSWEMVKLGDVCKNLDSKRKPVTKSDRTSGIYPYYGASGIVDYVEDYIFDGEYLLISEDGANLLARTTPIAFTISGKTWVNNHAHILEFENMNTQKYIEVFINQIDISNYVTGVAQPKLNQQALNNLEIPLPSLEIQSHIIEQIEKERQAVESCKTLVTIFEAKIKAKIDEVWGKAVNE